MKFLLDASIWPILLSPVIGIAVGIVWYGPLFGKIWMNYVGFEEADRETMQESAGPSYLITVVTALIFGYAMELIITLVTRAGVSGLGSFIVLSIIIWLGIQISTGVKPVLWEDKPKALILINGGNELVTIILVTVAAYYL